jgi:argininosuccinate lyase
MHKKLWGGRFSASTNSSVETFLASIHFDAELAYEDILGSLAHAAMLQQCNIISEAEHKALADGLRQIAKKIAAGEVDFHLADEDIHMNIERLLSEIIAPEIAGKLHTARSRNDQVALDIHLYLRRQVLEIFELLINFKQTLVQQAQQYQQVILPGYTHLQRAQPIRLSQHFLAYVQMLHRDGERLQQTFARINISPLGAAALASTSWPIDPHLVATSLGFDGVYNNSLDAVSDRDFIVEFLANAALIMLHLSRLSEELILWSSQEFNFISFADAYATGSSIMPQKKNPDVAELVRGKTGRVNGALISLLTMLKGLPLAYNKDMQEDKEALFDTVNTLRSCLAIYSPLLDVLTINAESMRNSVRDGFLNATDLADYLARSGMPFRAAHHVVGNMVAHCVSKNCQLEDLSLTEMQSFAPSINEEVYTVLNIEHVVEARDQVGGTSLRRVKQQIIAAEQKISLGKAWINDKKSILQGVEEHFLDENFSSRQTSDRLQR